MIEMTKIACQKCFVFCILAAKSLQSVFNSYLGRYFSKISKCIKVEKGCLP